MFKNHFLDPNPFIEFSNDIKDNYSNINDYNTEKDFKTLTVSDNMISDMISNKKFKVLVL